MVLGYSKNKIKVLVVDDSALMRRILSDILNGDDDIKVIDTAQNGEEAILKAQNQDFDVITLDVEMPVMDGLECLKKLSQIGNFKVVMVSSYTKENAEATIKSLEYGAIDFVAKPTNLFDIRSGKEKNEIINKVKLANKTKILNRGNMTYGNKESEDMRKEAEYYKTIMKTEKVCTKAPNTIVGLGISTGGPSALQKVLPKFPSNMNAAILIVQHMPAGFTKSLAERLNSVCDIKVKEAENGECIQMGCAYVAPGDYHMLVVRNSDKTLSIELSKEPPEEGHRPSVNKMMESLSKTGFRNVVGVIMTGMGGDGSEGIKKLKENNNAYIIAQDKESCTVFGMPRVAINTGVVDKVASLNDISEEIMKALGVDKKWI